MNILDKIIDKKKIEVEKRKASKSIYELEQGPFFKNKTLSFKEFLLREDKTGIVILHNGVPYAKYYNSSFIFPQ